MNKHSPLPLKVHRTGEFDETVLLDSGGGVVARVAGKADAILITQAVNSQEGLVNFARQIKSIPCGDRCSLVTECIHLKAEAVLKNAKAEGRAK